MRRSAWASLPFFVMCLAAFAVDRAAADPPAGWPANVQGDTGFADLGKAIKAEPGFPAKGSDVEKARYVFSRMSDVATSYGLKPGSGRKLSDSVIGLYRTFGNDVENADSLKGFFGWGNCGEWSYAFSEILGGSGVVCRVVYGDKDGNPGHSGAFTGTDTTVIVEERDAGNRISRRVFDAFRAAYHSPTAVPTDDTLQDWGDVPLTDDDRWQDEDKSRNSWQKTVGKEFVKDATAQKLLDGVPEKFRPGSAKRPGAPTGPITAILGTWDSDWGPVTFQGRGGKADEPIKFTGFWQQGPTMRGVIKAGTFDPKTRKLQFAYYQDWNDQNGKGELTLSDDGLTLSGTWTQDNGAGEWTMTRKK